MNEDCTQFDAFIKNLMEKEIVNDSIEKPATTHQCPAAKKTLYEYFFDKQQKAWIAYDWIVPQYIHDVNLKFNEIFVPTADTVRINQILNQLSNVRIT